MRRRPHGCVRADYWFPDRVPRKINTKFRRDNGVVPAPFERPTEEFLADFIPAFEKLLTEANEAARKDGAPK